MCYCNFLLIKLWNISFFKQKVSFMIEKTIIKTNLSVNIPDIDVQLPVYVLDVDVQFQNFSLFAFFNSHFHNYLQFMTKTPQLNVLYVSDQLNFFYDGFFYMQDIVFTPLFKNKLFPCAQKHLQEFALLLHGSRALYLRCVGLNII